MYLPTTITEWMLHIRNDDIVKTRDYCNNIKYVFIGEVKTLINIH